MNRWNQVLEPSIHKRLQDRVFDRLTVRSGPGESVRFDPIRSISWSRRTAAWRASRRNLGTES
jgi:hypothetical protein